MRTFLGPFGLMGVLHFPQAKVFAFHWSDPRGDNRIDLIAILPFWLNVLCGRFLPTASFLRVVRLTRLFRIFKSARYFDMVHVLGLTLWKSMSTSAAINPKPGISQMLSGVKPSQDPHRVFCEMKITSLLCQKTKNKLGSLHCSWVAEKKSRGLADMA